jgi:hypothetical protein
MGKSANFAYKEENKMKESAGGRGLICLDVAIKSGISHLQQLNHAKSSSGASRLLFCPLEQNAPPKTNIEFECWRRLRFFIAVLRKH